MLRWLLVAAAMLLSPPAFAQSMPGMRMGSPPAAGRAGIHQGYRDAMAKMDQGMSIPYTGDSDKDFVAGMIAHHQGAIDMAKVELQYGKDPQLKQLARNIIKSQNEQIAFMKSWQARHAQ